MQPTRRVHLKSTVAQPGATAAIVRLNIGGVRYLSTAQTLAQGENFFSALLSGKIPSLVDDEGYFFIDRDGRLFHYLLEFLRTGRLKVPPGVDEQDLVAEARFYSIDLHAFSPLSDAALLRWLEEKQSNLSMKQWTRHPELEEIKDKILEAFRHEQLHGEGAFQFVFYPEMEGGSVSKFIARLIAEDEVSPEHRKVIEACKTQLLRCDFNSHPYYPVSLATWKVLGLPQCQTLLAQYLHVNSSLSVDFRMSRIGVARVEKRQEQDGASLYVVHDFYALTGLDNARTLQGGWHEQQQPASSLRQQFDRCVSAIQVVWCHNKNNAVKSPKLSTMRSNEDITAAGGGGAGM